MTPSRLLVAALKSHLEETENHVSWLEQVFNSLDKRAHAEKCDAIAGLTKEAEDIMESSEEGAMCVRVLSRPQRKLSY